LKGKKNPIVDIRIDLDEDVTRDHVVQFNIVNVIIVRDHDHDRHRQSKN